MFVRHLTRWLKLPGLARSADPVWVTPRGVKPDVLGLRRMSPLFADYLVNDWSHEPHLFEPVEQMFLSVGGERVTHPVTAGDRTSPVIAAFVDERLWLWRMPVGAVGEPAVFPELPEPTPASGPVEPTGTWLLVDFWLERADGNRATHVASGAEDPKPQFKWILQDPDDLVTGGRIEFYRVDVPDLTPPFATLQLSLDQVLSRKRSFNGFTGASFLSCEGSPYRARLVVEGSVGRPQALNYQIRVDAVRLDLHLGPRSLLSQPKDLAVYDILAGYDSFDGNQKPKPVEDEHALLPLPKGLMRVVMAAHLFAAEAAELKDAADAPFEALELLWGNGAEVPLVASLFFRASDDSERLAPRAAGNRRVVWQWIEEPEDTSPLPEPVRKYVEDARNYRTSEPKPGSKLCHEDRGGKRSRTAPKMFTTNARLPFSVHPHDSDPTLAFSSPAENGDLAGRTGVIFTPPIQSGEHLKIVAFFDPKPIPGVDAPGKLDINQTFPRQLSPTFQTWHAINVVLHAGKKLAGSAVGPEHTDLSDAQRFFDPAFVVLRCLKIATRALLHELGDYDKAIKDAFDELLTGYVAGPLAKTGHPRWKVDPRDSRPAPVSPKPGRESFLVKDHVFDASVSPSSVGAAMRVHTPKDLLERYRIHAKLPATMPLQSVHRDLWAPEGGEVSGSAYSELAGHSAAYAAANAGSKLTQARAGGAGLRITEVYSQAEDSSGKFYSDHVGGIAFADNRRSGHVLVTRLFQPPMTMTFAHEVGHECFLPHPHGGNPDPDAHDPADNQCIMGSSDREHFCGRCVLRLRGWSMRGMRRNAK